VNDHPPAAATGAAERLREDHVLARARNQTGLDDFGDGDFRTGLARFLLGARDEAPLSARGVDIIEATVVRFLVNRLRLVDDIKRHPEILEERLAPPVIIMGLPRTGTTKFHRMMAVDERFKALRAWQILNPAPFPGGPDASGRDPRIAAAEQVDAMVDALLPQLMAGHAVRATEVDEESVTLMEMNFDYLLLSMRLRAPVFEAWTRSRPVLPNYRFLHRCLQYLQWQGGDDARPFVLKSPLHLSSLDALLEVFPDATLVQCHRDPVDACASFMRLAELGRGLCYEQQDLAALGSWVISVLADQVEANLRQRDTLGGRLEIIDVAFRDIAKEPFAAMEPIYAARGMPLPPHIREAMLDWESSHPSNRFGKFEYRLSDYGKEPQDVDRAFQEYRRRFGHLL
jgi:hypothetical protein